MVAELVPVKPGERVGSGTRDKEEKSPLDNVEGGTVRKSSEFSGTTVGATVRVVSVVVESESVGSGSSRVVVGGATTNVSVPNDSLWTGSTVTPSLVGTGRLAAELRKYSAVAREQTRQHHRWQNAERHLNTITEYSIKQKCQIIWGNYREGKI